MEELYFGKIFNFENSTPIQLKNSSYLEDLTGLLAETAACINNEMHYFFGDEFYLKSFDEQKSEVSFKHFSELFIKSYKHESQGQIHIIRGRAGVGKTQFFKRGVQYLIEAPIEIRTLWVWTTVGALLFPFI